MNKYKDWDGKTRLRMYTKLKRDEKANKLPKWLKLTGPCEMCEETHNTMPHAEEYGPTYKDYQKSIHVLCPRCHGMLHLRYRYPNKWEEYKEHIRKLQLKEVKPLKPLNNMNQLYHISKSWINNKTFGRNLTPKPTNQWWEKLSSKK